MIHMTPEQIEEVAENADAAGLEYAGDLLREYAALVSRQPEVSEEDVQNACRAYDNASDVNDDCCSNLAMRAALTAVWHN